MGRPIPCRDGGLVLCLRAGLAGGRDTHVHLGAGRDSWSFLWGRLSAVESWGWGYWYGGSRWAICRDFSGHIRPGESRPTEGMRPRDCSDSSREPPQALEQPRHSLSFGGWCTDGHPTGLWRCGCSWVGSGGRLSRLEGNRVSLDGASCRLFSLSQASPSARTELPPHLASGHS